MAETYGLPLENPEPDIREFKNVMLREKVPERVHFAEILFDKAPVKYLLEKYLGREWVDPGGSRGRKSVEAYLDNMIQLWHKFGYDYIRIERNEILTGGKNESIFPGNWKTPADSNENGDQRSWANENEGLINSWEDFEEYSWPAVDEIPMWPYEYLSENLPEGMGLFVSFTEGFLENLMNVTVGYVPLSRMLHRQPDLLKAISDKVGETIISFYRRIMDLPRLHGVFQGDDLGFKTSTLISPEHLRKYVLPWHEKLANLVHQNDLLYFLHTCGTKGPIIEDLIEDVGVDAIHSFEDQIKPVTTFYEEYGDRIGVLGGIDMDKLTRLPERKLREYVRKVLEKCASSGGYALGAGNSVADYVPIENYLAMMEEGLNWNP
ncbi:MAG: uroporphyrinogen decarboxylase family protein [Candidatus Bipolaricaulota bacterium]|nr:hypothetical protein [Candidatus Bipolaricaulota bacterium]MBS3792148.1 hypothetical protein [Candidatus Bipolaricaulota bacterium]